jgi:hypothetical protein
MIKQLGKIEKKVYIYIIKSIASNMCCSNSLGLFIKRKCNSNILYIYNDTTNNNFLYFQQISLW